MKNIKVLIGILICVIITYGLTSYAYKLSANDVTYDKKNSTLESEQVQGAIDELGNSLTNRKNQIISALTNKGFDISNNSSYSEIVEGINKLPITLSKDENGNYGYIGADGNIIPFNNNLDIFKLGIGVNNSYSFSSKSTSSSETANILSNGIELKVNSYHGKSVTIYTNEKIDFSKYNRVYIGFKGSCGDNATNGTLKFGVTTSIPNNDSSFTNVFISQALGYNSSSIYASSGNQCVYQYADISSIDTVGYLKIRLDMSYWYYTALIQEIRFE